MWSDVCMYVELDMYMRVCMHVCLWYGIYVCLCVHARKTKRAKRM